MFSNKYNFSLGNNFQLRLEKGYLQCQRCAPSMSASLAAAHLATLSYDPGDKGEVTQALCFVTQGKGG